MPPFPASFSDAPQHNDQAVHLAHISDPHLPPPSIPWSAFVLNKRLLSAILWKSKRQYQHHPEVNQALLHHIQHFKTLSALLVSGDITNFGTREEYQASVKWLNNLPVPPIVVPGNHDAMVAEPSEKTLDFWIKWSGKVYPFVRYINHVAVIGLNSAIPTLPFTAYGHISRSQLSLLDSLLGKLGDQGYCRVIMIHHPPKKGLMKRQKSLLNIKSFSDILRKRGAELVLHGHSHNATITHVENTDIPLLGIGAASMDTASEQRRASWNSLLFSQKKNGHYIDLTRYDYQGEAMARQQWLRPIKGRI